VRRHRSAAAPAGLSARRSGAPGIAESLAKLLPVHPHGQSQRPRPAEGLGRDQEIHLEPERGPARNVEQHGWTFIGPAPTVRIRSGVNVSQEMPRRPRPGDVDPTGLGHYPAVHGSTRKIPPRPRPRAAVVLRFQIRRRPFERPCRERSGGGRGHSGGRSVLQTSSSGDRGAVRNVPGTCHIQSISYRRR